jgi:hypothetical protein
MSHVPPDELEEFEGVDRLGMSTMIRNSPAAWRSSMRHARNGPSDRRVRPALVSRAPNQLNGSSICRHGHMAPDALQGPGTPPGTPGHDPSCSRRMCYEN